MKGRKGGRTSMNPGNCWKSIESIWSVVASGRFCTNRILLAGADVSTGFGAVATPAAAAAAFFFSPRCMRVSLAAAFLRLRSLSCLYEPSILDTASDFVLAYEIFCGRRHCI
jgi:hypothetical protein